MYIKTHTSKGNARSGGIAVGVRFTVDKRGLVHDRRTNHVIPESDTLPEETPTMGELRRLLALNGEA